MANNSLVSLLLPVYNAGHYLTETLESIRNQTHHDFEVIMVDDCSTDNSRKLMEVFTKQDDRFHSYENEENLGLAKTLNRAAALAHGNIFARIDADDVMLPARIEQQLLKMEATSAGLVASAYQVIDAEGNMIYTVKNYFKDWDELNAQLLFYNPFAHSSLMFARSVFEEVNGYDEALVAACDYDFLARLSVITTFAYVTQPLILYRRHGGSMTARLSTNQRATGDKVRKWLLGYYGFDPDDRQLELHQQIASAPSHIDQAVTPDLLKEMREWLALLKKKNIKETAFSPSSFSRTINWVHTRLYFNKDSQLTLRKTLLTLSPKFLTGGGRNLLFTLIKSAKNGIW